MAQEQITVETAVNAPIERVWQAYTSPEDIRKWNFASDDWCCPSASCDLREGGTFSFRMEAKDASMGFDFEGTYTKIVPNQRIEYDFGGRHAVVEFVPQSDAVIVRVSFDPETEHPLDQQRDGWQSILDNFARQALKASE
ncbi:SRPBCC family protein [Gemmobacter nectariphilus]|uniref:SRPBCC family protein n=1 Tax=Gemmobacter nectariphilus TaxID=220343 RepID=UPI000481B3AE|nr:SRPBCC family protein [Gemmobacter nectariphilus]